MKQTTINGKTLEKQLKQMAQENQIAAIRTTCCNRKPHRIGMSHCICPKCKRDVTMSLILTIQTIIED